MASRHFECLKVARELSEERICDDKCDALHPENSKLDCLVEAVTNDDYNTVRAYLAKHDVPTNEQTATQLLPFASGLNNTEIMRLLLAHGADFNHKSNGYTPLHHAIRCSAVDAVCLLLMGGANPNILDKNGEAPIHFVRPGDLPILGLLLKHGADVDSRDAFGITPLCKASANGLEAYARHLLENGADPSIKIKNGVTPILLAMKGPSLAIARLLVDHGADVNCQNFNGFAPLDRAVCAGAVNVAQFLLESGADPNLFEERGLTAMHQAVKTQSIAMMGLLIAHGANVNCQCVRGQTPLFFAAEETSRFLLDNRADPDLPDKDGFTAMHGAYRHLNVMRLLVEADCNINVQDKYGRTPLHWASEWGKVDVKHYLIEKGADPTIKDKFGRTASI